MKRAPSWPRPSRGSNRVSSVLGRRFASWLTRIHLKLHHSSIVYVGQTRYNEKMSHELRMTKKSGEVETHSLETATYLPIGWIGNVRSNMGPIEMPQIVEEFKTCDGELIPMALTADVGGRQEMVSTVTEVSFEKLPTGTSDPPQGIGKDCAMYYLSFPETAYRRKRNYVRPAYSVIVAAKAVPDC